MIGRRGLVQSAFTIKEIKELCRIDNLNVYMLKEEVENSYNEESLKEMMAGFSTFSRGIKRRSDYLKETCKIIENEEQLLEILNKKSKSKNLFLRYLLSPSELLDDGKEKLK